jgi:hypothetical protein
MDNVGYDQARIRDLTTVRHFALDGRVLTHDEIITFAEPMILNPSMSIAMRRVPTRYSSAVGRWLTFGSALTHADESSERVHARGLAGAGVTHL